MKPQLAIRTNANHEIGIGHIHRTLAYADYISDFFEVTFYIEPMRWFMIWYVKPITV